MFAPYTRLPHRFRQGLASIPYRSASLSAAALALALLTACGRLPPAPLASADPADASAPVPAARYGGTFPSYPSGRPVEAGPWREQNERIAPEPKP